MPLFIEQGNQDWTLNCKGAATFSASTWSKLGSYSVFGLNRAKRGQLERCKVRCGCRRTSARRATGQCGLSE
jgi:hypothetical protein